MTFWQNKWIPFPPVIALKGFFYPTPLLRLCFLVLQQTVCTMLGSLELTGTDWYIISPGSEWFAEASEAQRGSFHQLYM